MRPRISAVSQGASGMAVGRVRPEGSDRSSKAARAWARRVESVENAGSVTGLACCLVERAISTPVRPPSRKLHHAPSGPGHAAGNHLLSADSPGVVWGREEIAGRSAPSEPDPCLRRYDRHKNPPTPGRKNARTLEIVRAQSVSLMPQPGGDQVRPGIHPLARTS